MADPAPRSPSSSKSADPARVASGAALDETHVPSAGKDKALDATVVGDGQQTPPAPAAGGSQARSVPQPEGASGAKKVAQLGDFKLVKKLGQGGMGEVYLATQVSLDRKVALKTLSKELAKKQDFVQRFLREAKSMARLQHPNVVQVYAADSQQGIHFVAIEYIDGRSMQKWMDQLGRLSVGDALHVTLVCAEALKHAHDQNMIHRDIKPDNILVTSKGMVKVADFGLAKAMDEDVSMTQSGTGLGTPLYMAPEQARNAKHVDQRTDIYALGSTLYYFLTGKLPFTGTNTLELIQAKELGRFTSARRLNSEVPERLALMIDKMMAKDPAHRYASCDEVIRDLAGLGLESPSLSFISAEDAVTISRSSSGPRSAAARSAAPRTAGSGAQRPVLPPSSAEDAARQQTQGADKVWIVQHTNAQGKVIVSKLTTAQIQQGIRGEMIDLKAKAKRTTKEDFAPLAQFAEFTTLMEARVIKARADAKAGNMKEMYAKLDKQDQRRKRWRFLWRWLDNVKGGVGLLIWLAVVFGVIAAAGWAGYVYAWPHVKGWLGM